MKYRVLTIWDANAGICACSEVYDDSGSEHELMVHVKDQGDKANMSLDDLYEAFAIYSGTMMRSIDADTVADYFAP
jgi:hypothetical protein